MNFIKTLTIMILLIVIYPRTVIAQNHTDNDYLTKFAERKTKEDSERQQRVKLFNNNNILQKQKPSENVISADLYDVIDDQPIYEIPLGLEQIETVQANSLWPGNDLGLNITGEGYNKIGLWIGNSYTIYDHSEFTGRMKIEDVGGDYYINHDTVIAGVIMGEGINNDSKGIAYQCSLKVYRSADMLSEIASAVIDGMEISSYSWATTTCYSDFEASIDTIAYKAPYYLFFQAGGNTNTRLYGQGKNSISVGSVYTIPTPPTLYTGPQDVIIGNSQHGPAIDGRIKPDIMTPGGSFIGVYNTNDYGASGPSTSYSTPVAAGVGVLLQQYYQETHSNSPMYSSDLKCLLIHTADEAGGADGPDYNFGWGLLNAKRAANYIALDAVNTNIIDHPVLNNGEVYQQSFFSDGTKPIKVTICWTDPPSSASGCSDFTPRLVNDLDLKIIKDGLTFYPWTLDPSNIDVLASNNTKNYLDNVEQVYIAEPSAGIYTIQITHDGNLSNDGIFTDGTQSFSIIELHYEGQQYENPVAESPNCDSGEIIYNSDTDTFNFCKNGEWIEINFSQ